MVVFRMPRLRALAPAALTLLMAAGAAAEPPPVRDPAAPGYVQAMQLADGAVPDPAVDGDYILGPTHLAAPEMSPRPGVPRPPAPGAGWLHHGRRPVVGRRERLARELPKPGLSGFR